SDEIMETYMISIQTDKSFDELEEKEIQLYISSPENSMKENDNESYF
ncbi:1001_t:CDS:1, partial [Funneliformis caledonium]